MLKPASFWREQHHLLLVHRDAVGLLQELLHLGQVIGDLLEPVLALDEAGDVFQRARAEEGVHGDEVAEAVRLQLAQVLLHAHALELERAVRLRALVQLEGLRVIERDAVDVDLDAMVLIDHAQRIADDRERLQPQEVHLDHARVLHHLAVVLGK